MYMYTEHHNKIKDLIPKEKNINHNEYRMTDLTVLWYSDTVITLCKKKEAKKTIFTATTSTTVCFDII